MQSCLPEERLRLLTMRSVQFFGLDADSFGVAGFLGSWLIHSIISELEGLLPLASLFPFVDAGGNPLPHSLIR